MPQSSDKHHEHKPQPKAEGDAVTVSEEFEVEGIAQVAMEPPMDAGPPKGQG